MTPPKSKSLILSPPIAAEGLVDANFSKPAPKSKSPPAFSGSFYYLTSFSYLTAFLD